MDAVHKNGLPANIRYSITAGNEDRIFSVDGKTGNVVLSAPLDYEKKTQYDLRVMASSDNDVAWTWLRVVVEDVNDNPPRFAEFPESVAVIEEHDRDLPTVLTKVIAIDEDSSSDQGLFYTLEGDGVSEDDPSKGAFVIHPSSGELLQIQSLDRDLPNGMPVWKLKIRVFDGQTKSQITSTNFSTFEYLFQDHERGKPMKDSLFSRDSDETKKGVTRHRRDATLFSTKYIPTFSAVKERNIIVPTVAYFTKPQKEDITWYKNADSWLKPSRKFATSINSSNRIKSDVYANYRERANIHESTKPIFLSRFQRSFQRVLKSIGQYRSSIRITAPSGVEIGEKVKRLCKIDSESYENNRVEKSPDNGFNSTVKFSPNGSQDNFSKSNAESITWRKFFCGLETAEFPRPLNETLGIKDIDRQRKLHFSNVKGTNSRVNINRTTFYKNLSSKSKHKLKSIKSIRKRQLDRNILQPEYNWKVKLYPKSFSYNKKYPFQYKTIKKHFSHREQSLKKKKIAKMLRKNSKNIHTRHSLLSISDNANSDFLRERKLLLSILSDGQNRPESSISMLLPRGRVRRSPTANDGLVPKHLTCPSVLSPIRPQNPNKTHVLEKEFTVFVKDINDNVPVFTKTTYHMSVKENGNADELVGMVTATDADDVTFGTNALLTYSLEKNVVEEHTGERLFKIDSASGEIRTALCCLDRELAAAYRLQAVASDGGGLQGTATVLVEVEDENDNPPRFSRREWVARAKETFGRQDPSREILLEAAINDPDQNNFFACRIIHSSGAGWQLFDVQAEDYSCRLRAAKLLDYENEHHRKGFKFKIQVSDQGKKNWADPRHTDTALVRVSLVDVNDHSPSFNASHRSIEIRENTEVDTEIITLAATDKDSGANGDISYALEDPFNAFRIDNEGVIWVDRPLDREGPAGAQADIEVTATDGGTSPLTGKMVLSVTLLDVNDCPPSLVHSETHHVRENSSPAKIGVLLAHDGDVEHLRHGPPFEFRLAFTTPEASQNITLKNIPALDNGKGGAEIWTLTPLDREQHSQIILDVNISDVGGLTSNQKVTVIVDDINDNRMAPGNKIIYALKPEVMVSDYRLGRVFVNDPDDWDLGDKSFYWADDPHPQFILDEEDGVLHASSSLPDGRYNLRFTVSDHFWQQFNVKANVSVLIQSINPEMFLHAVSINLFSVSRTHLVKDWTPMGGGGVLGSFIDGIRHSLKDFIDHVGIVSIEENPATVFDVNRADSQSSCGKWSRRQLVKALTESSKVWIAASVGRTYLDPVKLRGLLELRMGEIAQRSSLIFSLEGGSENAPRKYCFPSLSQFSVLAVSPFYESFLATTNHFQMQVVDLNYTSFVTAVLSPPSFQKPLEPSADPFSNLSRTFSQQPPIVTSLLTSSSDRGTTLCTKGYCLNGGQCIPTATASRCICPGHTLGPRCKVVSRTFLEGGWAWLPRLPSCMPLRVSFRFLTLDPDGLILYQGPLSTHETDNNSHSIFILALHLERGLPVLTLEHAGMEVKLSVTRNQSLADGKWHLLHFTITKEDVSLLVDFCASEAAERTIWDTSDCFSSLKFLPKWKNREKKFSWGSEAPLQIGGAAHPRFSSNTFQRNERTRPGKGFRGCLSRLTIQRKLMDLGQPAHSVRSRKHCIVDEERLCDRAFPPSWDSPYKEECKNSSSCPTDERGTSDVESRLPCDCTEGAASLPACEPHKRPVTLGAKSYSSFALSFVPDPQRVSIRLKFKTKSKNGLLVLLSSRKAPHSLSLHISNRHLCLTFSTNSSPLLHSSRKSQVKNTAFPLSVKHINSSSSAPTNLTVDEQISHHLGKTKSKAAPDQVKSLCLTKITVSDSAWHTAYASRFGDTLVLQVDAGETWQYNETLPAFGDKNLAPPREFWVDIREGVLVGGVPEFIRRNASQVFQDLSDTCLDDLKISGRQLPLPPAVNNTDFGQVTTMQGMSKGCIFSSEKRCLNKHCPQPLQCHDVQGQAVCGCKTGEVFTPSVCRKMDLCAFSPCLNGGTCRRTKDSFSCLCPAEITGKYCEWDNQFRKPEGLNMLLVLAVSASAILLFILALVLFVSIRKRKLMKKRGNNKKSSPISDLKKIKDASKSSVIGIKTIKEMAVLLPQDDLRNYAYEGEGSSAESLGSVFKGIQNEIGDPLESANVAPNLCEVVDLLKGLPDAAPSILKSKSSKTPPQLSSTLQVHKSFSELKVQTPPLQRNSAKESTSDIETHQLPATELSELAPGATISV